MSEELCFTPALTLRELVRERRLSPVELVRAILDRLGEVGPAINAFVTLDADRALEDARAAERAVVRDEPRARAPLNGVPMTFKDLTPTRGLRTTYGSLVFERHVPDEDAAIVERVRAAGAIILGKTNTPEFGCKLVTDNRLVGTTRNPWDPLMTSGGSSGGAAAAVAAGLGPLAEGSDLAGSIRVPAAFCGVVGFKPGAGRVPAYPADDAWFSLWIYGPLARTVGDAALLYDVFRGADDRDPTTLVGNGGDTLADAQGAFLPPRLPVAWTADLGYTAVDPRVASIARRAANAFAALGCRLEEAHPGFEDPDDLFRSLVAPWRAATVGGYVAAWGDRMDPVLTQRIHLADRVTSVELARLQIRRTELYHRVRRFFERYALLLTPTTALPPFPVDASFPPTEVAGRPVTSPLAWSPFTFPFNLTGHPAITVPAGFTDDGLPVGLQIVGPRHGEPAVLRAAAAFEVACPWAHRRPQLKL